MNPEWVIIGSGKLATALVSRLFENNEHNIHIVARNVAAISELQGRFPDLKQLSFESIPAGSICLLAVSDSAIESCALRIKSDDCIKIHFSGATSIQVLQGNSAVLWPIHSFSIPEAINWSEITLVAESSTDPAHEKLSRLIEILGGPVAYLNENQRLQMHMLAVFANNFTNHLFRIAFDYCEQHKLDFALLRHLILQSTQALNKFKPAELQTGPAMRNDFETMQQHQAILKDNREMLNLYLIISESIRNHYSH
ncbi:MAG: DUF2520 domain-containing protein [Bacteroidetes bacterium]|nr:DUF2520 domain-containing protein [Bacteroidota bacterium]